jgi:pyrroloquinoline-quinone synthase
MELKYKLLEHPFYQSWEMGKITFEQLSDYGISYKEFISSMPDLWQKVIDSFNINDNISREIIKEEHSHIGLWEKWIDKLETPKDYSSMSDILAELGAMSPSELLGAIHSFEIQQPEVAFTKKKGLLSHYGFQESDLNYFDEHFDEQKHIEYGINLSEHYADKELFEKGFLNGSELFYKALDRFIVN